MPAKFIHPLTEEHLACCDKVLKTVQPALDLAQACTDCGWDVSHIVAQLNEQKAMAERVKARFFPDQP